MDFFTGILFRLINAKRLDIEDSILVVCGGQYDANCLRDANIKNITISNLDVERQIGYDCKWAHQDAESLTFPDASFDWVIVNAGLHHCASPHRALLEMFRTCKKGIILVEARDSAFNRLAVKMNLSSEFELEAVVLDGGKSGGVRNTAVPTISTDGLRERS
jgi:SAM-dependent methyltransferase